MAFPGGRRFMGEWQRQWQWHTTVISREHLQERRQGQLACGIPGGVVTSLVQYLAGKAAAARNYERRIDEKARTSFNRPSGSVTSVTVPTIRSTLVLCKEGLDHDRRVDD